VVTGRRLEALDVGEELALELPEVRDAERILARIAAADESLSVARWALGL